MRGRYFVLSDGEIKYYKTEKAAHLSNIDSLKSIRLEHVIAAIANPRHTDMFIIDLGLERKVKLQARGEQERDAWVAAIEAAKLRAWNSQERPPPEVIRELRCSVPRSSSSEPLQVPVAPPLPTPGLPTPLRSGVRGASGRASQFHTELLHSAGRQQGCCCMS